VRKLMAHAENEKLRNWIVDSKCKCSFECALAAGAVWSPANYPRMVARSIGNIGSKDRRAPTAAKPAR
jgi:hypothetical protein